MLKFVENAYVSMLEKEREEKLELQNARKRNEELKNKLRNLEEENGELKEKFKQNQIEIITRKNDLNYLSEELQRERRANLVESQRLQICREQIESINNFIDELKPIKEQLSFKKNVTECLHDLLIKTKLRIAESDDVLQQLHDFLTDLEHDVEKTRNLHKQGVSHWQDEFLAARLREADVILEFDKLKRELAIIRHELEEKKLIREAKELTLGKNMEESKKYSLRKNKDRTYEKILEEEERAVNNTMELQNEIDYLRHQIRKLEDQNEDCEKRIRSNEEIKMNLHEVRRSIFLREFETNQKIENLREKYRKLSEKMSQELEKIQGNVEDKDLAIARIEEKIKELQKLNGSLEEDMKNGLNQDPSQGLEEEKLNLEEEIVRLKKT